MAALRWQKITNYISKYVYLFIAMLVNSFIYSDRSKQKQTLSGGRNMHAIHANFSYSTKIISCELLKCLCFRMFLKRQYCVRISVCVSLHPVLFIWRWWEVVSSVCGGLQRDSVFSVRMVEKIIFVYFERVKKHQKKLELECFYWIP